MNGTLHRRANRRAPSSWRSSRKLFTPSTTSSRTSTTWPSWSSSTGSSSERISFPSVYPEMMTCLLVNTYPLVKRHNKDFLWEGLSRYITLKVHFRRNPFKFRSSVKRENRYFSCLQLRDEGKYVGGNLLMANQTHLFHNVVSVYILKF